MYNLLSYRYGLWCLPSSICGKSLVGIICIIDSDR